LKKESSGQLIRDYGLAVILAVLIALFIRYFVIEAYRIPSPAMRPVLEAGDTVFVAKWTYGFRAPWSTERLSEGRKPRLGEIVVFSFPDEPKRNLIRRVVGLPGDVIEIKQGHLFFNGHPANLRTSDKSLCGQEVLNPSFTYTVCWEPPLLDVSPAIRVGENQVFVVGDARSDFPDAKSQKNWGIVPMSSLKGKALWIWLSIEPQSPGAGTPGSSWFSRVRFERMFTPIH
jgi:signal peptidase I